MKKMGVLIPILLTIVLAFSMIPNAFAGTWIYYDDGTLEGNAAPATAGLHIAVKFTSPCSGYILTARYYNTNGGFDSFNVHVIDSDGSTSLFGPLTVTPTSIGWFDVDLSSYDILVSGDFYITLERIGAAIPWIARDTTDPDGRSYAGTPGSWTLQTGSDYMIRAEVDCHPVGGIFAPVNKLNILAPYIALVGLIGAISTIFAIRRWRKD